MSAGLRSRALALVVSTVSLAALAAPANAYDSLRAPPRPHAPALAGTLAVSNFAGGRVTLRVEGMAPRSLAPGETLTFGVGVGERQVVASYVQFGVEHILQTDRVVIGPGRSAYVALRAETTARVLVNNGFDESAELLLDGRSRGTLRPGETRILDTRTGTAQLALVTRGRTLAATRINLVAFAEPSWRPEAPPVGDLVVQNPLPIPVELVCDRGLVRTVAPYGRTVYEDVPVGTFHLTARRLTGERIDDEVAIIRRNGDTAWRIDAPTRGLVELDSDHFLAVRVRVDGRTVATLAADEERRLELALGFHRLEVADDRGRVILDTWVDVDPFDTTFVNASPGRHRQAYHDDDRRYDDRQADRRDDYARVDVDDDAQASAGCALPPSRSR